MNIHPKKANPSQFSGMFSQNTASTSFAVDPIQGLKACAHHLSCGKNTEMSEGWRDLQGLSLKVCKLKRKSV
jgi:hypothetical protein